MPCSYIRFEDMTDVLTAVDKIQTRFHQKSVAPWTLDDRRAHPQ